MAIGAPEAMTTMRFSEASDVWSFGTIHSSFHIFLGVFTVYACFAVRQIILNMMLYYLENHVNMHVIQSIICVHSDGILTVAQPLINPTAVVCLEIFTDGEKPYTGMDNAAVINKVQAGYRAPKPPTCTGMFYAVLLSCWNAIPIKRMTFSQIATVIGPMVPGGTAIQAITFNASRAFSSSHDQGGSKTSLDSQSSSDESLEDYADMSGQAEVQVNEEAHTRARRASLDRDSEVAAADDAAAAIAVNGGRQAVSAKKKKKQKKEKKKNSKMKQGSSAKQTDTNDGGYMAVTSTPGGKAAEETKKKGSSKKKTEMRQEAALAFNSDTYMQVEDPRAMPAVPPTIESAYLQIGQSRDGVQKQNPIFAE